MGLQKCISRSLSYVGADVIWHSSRNVKTLVLLRMVRLLGYGGTTFVLALYLSSLGFGDPEVGMFMTLTLVGDLAISFALTYIGDGLGVRWTVLLSGLLMCLSGIAFATLDNYWLLLLASIAGVINPSANEIDPFKAIEEAAIARLSSPETRNEIFAWWSMLGMLGTASSNLLTGWVLHVLKDSGFKHIDAYRVIFLGYAAIGLVKILCCALLSSNVELRVIEDNNDKVPEDDESSSSDDDSETGPLLARTSSRATCDYGTVHSEAEEAAIAALAATGRRRMFTPASFTFMWQLSLAMAFDFIGSGLAQISWMTYFFKREYDIPESALGSATFTAGIISSILNLASSPLSRAIGQVPTMVLCHTINSISLLMVSVPGNKYVALIIFIFRIVTREIDNAPRQAFISAGVLDEERTSAMGVINIVKTIGSCIGLYSTGLFAGMNKFWLAFIVAGALKLVYNVLISAFFWRRARQN